MTTATLEPSHTVAPVDIAGQLYYVRHAGTEAGRTVLGVTSPSGSDYRVVVYGPGLGGSCSCADHCYRRRQCKHLRTLCPVG